MQGWESGFEEVEDKDENVNGTVVAHSNLASLPADPLCQFKYNPGIVSGREIH